MRKSHDGIRPDHDEPALELEAAKVREVATDEVFGVITEEGPNYRAVGWLGTAGLMMKIQIGLGVLSIPSAFASLGLIPGVLGLIAIGVITAWCNWAVGVFKLNHREVYGIDDAMGLIFGPVAREFLAVAFYLTLIFAASSGTLGISIAFNAMSTHGACTAVFVAVSAIMVIAVASIRTLHRMSSLAWVGLVSLLVACFMVVIAVAVQDRPDAAPQEGVWKSDYKLVGNPTFAEATAAFSTYIFAYAGTPSFFPIIAEMRDPRQYNKALVLCQTVVTITYIICGIVIYYYCGTYVASPALGSAGKLIKQISYGLALPGLLLGAVINSHVVSKSLFVRFLRGSEHLVSNSLVHWVTWIGCVVGVGGIGYIIASAVPNFGSLISLVGALFATLMCFIPPGCMWLYDNWHKGRTERTLFWTCHVIWVVFVLAAGSFLMVAGTYGAIKDIIDSYRASAGKPFSCADNSNSV